jgi:TonB family protein
LARRNDRFDGRVDAPGSAAFGRRLIAGAALASVLGHAVAFLALSLHYRPSAPAAQTEIPVEVVFETALPAAPKTSPLPPEALFRRDEADRREIAHAGHEFERAAAQPAAEKPRSPPRAKGASASGLDRNELRAVAIPMPADDGDEVLHYDVVVLGRLERVKQFPKTAVLRGARGTAVVGFALDESGRVIVAALLRSSGDEALDIESLALVRRAAPFPKPPPGARRRFAVDIAFGMNG